MTVEPVAAIETVGLSKRFGTLQALRDVSFQVAHGSVFCILGPNGAGKSTLIRILTTITRPNHGTVRIEGLDLPHDILQIRQRIGVVSQDNHFDRYLTIWHNLTLHAQMHGLPRSVYEPRIQGLLEQVGLSDRRRSLPDDLSGGMQRRVALIRALLHEPSVLFLDEPTTGLDPQARLEIWQTLEQMKHTTTVVLTTHYMEEADRLSDRILLLNHGHVVAEGTAGELKQRISPSDHYAVTLQSPEAQAMAAAFSAHVTPMPSFSEIRPLDDRRFSFRLTDPAQLVRLFDVVPGAQLEHLGRSQAGLEEVFLTLAGQPLAETP